MTQKLPVQAYCFTIDIHKERHFSFLWMYKKEGTEHDKELRLSKLSC